MAATCGICSAQSEQLVEFNGVLTCGACFRNRIQLMAAAEKQR